MCASTLDHVCSSILLVNSAQVVMCVVVVYTRSVESWVSVDVKVALRAVSVMLHQPIAFQVNRGENVRRVPDERDRNRRQRHTHCTKFDVLLVDEFTVRTLHCERLAQARDGFQILPIRLNVISPVSSSRVPAENSGTLILFPY